MAFCVEIKTKCYTEKKKEKRKKKKEKRKKKKEEAMHVDKVIVFLIKKREEQRCQQEIEKYIARHCKLDQSHNIDN